MQRDEQSNRLSDRLTQARETGQRVMVDIGRTIGRTAASAGELLSDAELRRKGRILLVHEASRGIREIQQKVGNAAETLGRHIQNGAGTIQRGIYSGPRHLQGALERVRQRVNEARLASLLEWHSNLTVDVQIATKLYEDAPQEIRSRLWATLTQHPLFRPINFLEEIQKDDQDQATRGASLDKEAGREDDGWELIDNPFQSNKSHQSSSPVLSIDLESLLEAMGSLDWPLDDRIDNDSNYGILIQITIGQDEIDEIIQRDLHRTFPELPQFNLPEKRTALFNILKAYSLHDLEVGYCQGMGFVAGVLLLYLPEEWSFRCLCFLMSEKYVNLRRFYVPGLDPLKKELWKLEFLLEKHLPILDRHLKEHGIAAVLYASQWFLTCFACPFADAFAARVLDFMMQEKSCDPLIRTAFSVLVHLGEELLRLDNFEDILTHIKVQPVSWDIRTARSVLSATLSSSITSEELRTAEASYDQQHTSPFASSDVPEAPSPSDPHDNDQTTRSEEQDLQMMFSMDMILDVDVTTPDASGLDRSKTE